MGSPCRDRSVAKVARQTGEPAAARGWFAQPDTTQPGTHSGGPPTGMRRPPRNAGSPSSPLKQATPSMVFRPLLLATDGHSNLDANLVADIERLHRQRVALKQPSDHLGCRHDLRFGAPVGHRLLGECPDPRLELQATRPQTTPTTLHILSKLLTAIDSRPKLAAINTRLAQERARHNKQGKKGPATTATVWQVQGFVPEEGDRNARSVTITTGRAVVPTFVEPATQNQTLAQFHNVSSESRAKRAGVRVARWRITW